MKIEINNTEIIAQYGSLLRNSSSKEIVNLDNHQLNNFDVQINRIENLVKEFNGTMLPNKISHHVLALITRGNGKKKIGYHKFDIASNMLFIIPSKIIHSSENWNLATKGYMLTFNESIFTKIKFPQNFIKPKELFKLSQNPYTSVNTREAKAIKKCFEELLCFKESSKKYSDEIFGLSLAKLIFYYKSALEVDFPRHSKTHHIFEKFIDLVELNFKKEKSVKFYADKLAVHQNHLNHLVKNELNTSAKDLIIQRIVQEAEYYLVATQNSIKEISFQLGFDDTNYFSKFFKKKTGRTPSQIRE